MNTRLAAVLFWAVLWGATSSVVSFVSYERGQAHVRAMWDAERLRLAEEAARVQAEALATAQKLQADKDRYRRDKDAQIARLNASLAAALDGLRQRPARDGDGGVPRDPATGTALGATGAELLRQDAEFLVREAARANRLRLDLAECQAAYERARAALR